MDLVSIIVPVYNVEKYLKECIDSIVHQTYKNTEIILVDDGSKDSSGIICDNFQKENTNIKVYHKNNSGVSDTRNFGIKKATGKFITFIDSDDVIDNNFIEKMVNKSNDCDLVCCNYSFWYKDKKIDNQFNNVGIMDRESIKKELFKKNSIKGYSCNKLFKTSIIKDNNIEFSSEIKICEDLLFCFKYCQYINQAFIIEDNLYYYRMRKTSASNYNNEKDLTVFKAFSKMYELDNKVYEYGKSLYAYIFFKYRKMISRDSNVKKLSLVKTLIDKDIYFNYKFSIIAYSLMRKKNYNYLKNKKQKKLNYFE